MGAGLEKKRAELVRKLTELIREPGRFPDGHLPSERELAQSLGVSRNLLREAIITLEVMGLLEIRERQGAYIRTPQPGEYAASLKLLSVWPGDILAYIMEMRLVIEAPAAALAAERREEEELVRMKDCLRHLDEVERSCGLDAAECARWDTILHSLILGAAHNPVLQRVYEGFYSTMEEYIVLSRRKLLAIEGWAKDIRGQHWSLVDAIERRDPEAASAALREHLGKALDKLNEMQSAQRSPPTKGGGSGR